MAKLVFKYSSMNAGKSTNLLQQNHNFTSRGLKVFLAKPSIDTRSTTIKSGLGVEAKSFNFDSDLNLFDYFIGKHSKIDLILIDEAQFLTSEQVWQLSDIVDTLGISVFCYGLRTNFMGESFPGSKALLEICDSFEELKSVCSCGNKASMALKFDSNGDVVRSGESIDCGAEDKYISVCRACWKKGKIYKINPSDKRDF